MKRTARNGAAWFAIFSLGAAFIWIAAFPRETIPEIAGTPPRVSLLYPGTNGQDLFYRATLIWTGSDPDSGDAIHHYQIGFDPPSAFTSAEIAHPETAPTVTIMVRPGPDAARDTIQVTKSVGDSVYTFFWIGTPDTSGSFRFTTPNPDSEYVGGQIVPLQSYSGAHRVFVRAEDLNGTISETDSVSFTARNPTPETQITYPDISSEIADLGPALLLKAFALDLPVLPTPLPGYLVNVVRLDTLDPPIPIIYATPSILFRHGTWVPQPGSLLDTTIVLDTPAEYIVGVRAVDENGGIDPILAFGRNAFKFRTFADGGAPDLTIYEPSFGHLSFRGRGSPQDAYVTVNRELNFSWLASAERYGGQIEAYSWGLDIPFPDVEGPGSGWSEWSQITAPPDPIVFHSGGTHILYVRARDLVGTITLAQVVLHVLEFTFDREVLLVDDSFDNLSPNDAQHDAFWQDMASFYATQSDIPPDQFFVYSVHGDNDRGNLAPNVPALSELARYKILVWENAGWGYNSDSALIQSTALNPILSAYLEAGGKLWLDGRMNVAATTPDPNLAGADLVYPKTELGPGDWAWDFLKLHSTKIDNDRGRDERLLLHSVWPFPGAAAVYDSMTVDLDKLSLYQRSYGGFSHADAVFDPIHAEAEPGFSGDIDSLYAYGAAGTEVRGRWTPYHGKLCALRWHDPQFPAEHGRVQWFGFPLYYMQQDQARKTFKQSLDWLREDDGIVPVAPVTFTATRAGPDVLLEWEVTDANATFRVYRQEPARERERIDAPSFSGKLNYRFIDRTAPSGRVDYWLAGMDRSGSVSWNGPMSVGPATTLSRPVLETVNPNPVIRSARIRFSLPRAVQVLLTLHDVSGRQVATLQDGLVEPGDHAVDWSPSEHHLAAGFYLIRLRAGGFESARKVLVLP